ncbi:MAG: hypothetical protein KKF54_05660, partial [Candidatus Omnitrophica bacterium]|nr:hypothetical protein [Candidatus Omnitrophota bacterium]
SVIIKAKDIIVRLIKFSIRTSRLQKRNFRHLFTTRRVIYVIATYLRKNLTVIGNISFFIVVIGF